MKPRIVAKIPSLEGWYAVVLDKNRPDPTPPGKTWVTTVEVKHWGLLVPERSLNLGSLLFPFGTTSPQHVPLDQESEIIEHPIGFFGPGETFEDWIKSWGALAKVESRTQP